METAALYNLFLQYPSVTTDSRICPKDSIFFALKGDRFNGNLFAEKAIEAGCAYAVVDEEPEKENDRIILVKDALHSLQKLANWHRKKLKIPIIGITGTNGKTTTKELVAVALSKEFKVAYTQGNLNNHIGVPLTLLSMNRSHEIGVVEMGASHPGDIKELCEIAEPNYGIVTNVGKAHMEGFGSFENLVATKCELYDFIREGKGKVFVNKDNPILYEQTEGMDRILYGKNDPSLFASGSIANATPFLEFDWSFFDNSYRVKTRLVGEFNFDNAIAAVAVSKFFGINAEQISAALEEYEPTNLRSQFKRTEKNDLIIDAYNANPTSMKAALEFFSSIPSSLSKMVILGEMKELGESSDEEHEKIVQLLKQQPYDKVYLVGSAFNKCTSENESFRLFDDVDLLIETLKKKPVSNHYILLKGSHSVHLEKAVDSL
ncbi:UDP-N-acetylmuramyl pentapeptide synthase [Proteiniphilum saccharofermentans]|uniref:UDP-N-acetylmuramoyl-tripeptide--D-alanyl-D-alanine ligase n=1 Tax=Proteiniphilum saccharofermentans TaxID=1642647 RepID=A0A1R3TA13_9BACT|nr:MULTISPECIES: UDP-N-acetylmuramoyl-tripeptide--D-alanyl-D-alanine ligase [Proteiniphilum]MDY9919179.1 UDP-N-acetylmuramoyl-tripeptide--D-alanyl-D-alanine ligase [Proteiniphilum sp.]SCD21457.1 UDP-N-acetylmuramyl pentapeptide synthase [Proteiniphilum saccharofermentans]